jgi:hypothetical protein
VTRGAELERIRGLIGGRGDSLVQAVTRFKSLGVEKIHLTTISHLKTDPKSGIVTAERLLAADMLNGGSVRAKDQFLLTMAMEGLRAQGITEIDLSNGMPLPVNGRDQIKLWVGFSDTVSQRLHVQPGIIARLNKVIRADLVYEEPVFLHGSEKYFTMGSKLT